MGHMVRGSNLNVQTLSFVIRCAKTSSGVHTIGANGVKLSCNIRAELSICGDVENSSSLHSVDRKRAKTGSVRMM